MAQPWSIVIPSDSPQKLLPCVTSIRKAHPKLSLDRVIVVTKLIGAKDLDPSISGISLVKDDGPFCFARRVNKGFAKAGKNDVVVMGDDVELVTPDSFDIISREAPLRIVAASVRGRVGPWWQTAGQNHCEVPFVSFTCVYIPRMVYEIVGPIEDAFPGYGYEDTDYCLRARRAGLSCGVSGSVIIEHGVKLGSEFINLHGTALHDMEEAARRSFWQKWKRRLV